ncbi:MAG: PilZ domain-containing protein, partial [Nitrospirae bacterium]
VMLSVDGELLHARTQSVNKDKIVFRILEPFERRAFFRIDDAVQLKARKVPQIKGFSRKLSIPGTGSSHEEETAVDLLKAINEKLEFLIQHLILKEEGFFEGEVKSVNLSAGGIRFSLEEPVEVGDILELKITLPAKQPIGLVLYGRVVRVDVVEYEGKRFYETAVKFEGLTEDVRETIIQYTLQRQRECLRRRNA